jgi:apolipoprotein N-acyltransferase
MIPPIRQLKRFDPIIFLCIGMLFFLFSNGRFAIPIAAWLAPVFLLHYTHHQKPIKSLAILLVLFIFSAGFMLLGIIPSSLGFLTYVLFAYYALLWFLPYVFDLIFSGQLKGFTSTLVFPLSAVALEYINTVFFGSWSSVAYTQTGNLPLLQLMSITGMWGITFIVLWFGPVVNWIIKHDLYWQRVRHGVFIYAVILCATLLYGGARLGTMKDTESTVRISSFTPVHALDNYSESLQQMGYSSSSQAAVNDRSSLGSLLDTMHMSMFHQTRQEIQNGASLVLWPEGTTNVLEENESLFLSKASTIAKEEKAWLLLAYLMIPGENPTLGRENKCVLIDDVGRTQWEYLKTYPVPGSTDKAGDGKIPVIDTHFGTIGSVICYDMDYTNLVVQAGRKSVDIMLVPAWDWKAITPLHAEMAVYRAIENGFSMVRQTGDGISIAVDPYGRVLSRMDHYTSNDHRMTASAPTIGLDTVYGYIGDSFAWLCCTAFLLLIINSFLKRLLKS